jgi:hypothetical protein
MMRTLLGITLAFTWGVALPLAQQQPPRAESTPAHNTFVLAGCLVAPLNETSAFKLTDASPIGQAPPSRGTQPKAVGTTGEKVTYELQPTVGVAEPGLDAAALKPHVGQRVQVTVRPVETAAAPLPAAGAVPDKAPAAPVERAPERFTVTAIEHAGSCK